MLEPTKRPRGRPPLNGEAISNTESARRYANKQREQGKVNLRVWLTQDEADLVRAFVADLRRL